MSHIAGVENDIGNRPIPFLATLSSVLNFSVESTEVFVAAHLVCNMEEPFISDCALSAARNVKSISSITSSHCQADSSEGGWYKNFATCFHVCLSGPDAIAKVSTDREYQASEQEALRQELTCNVPGKAQNDWITFGHDVGTSYDVHQVCNVREQYETVC